MNTDKLLLLKRVQQMKLHQHKQQQNQQQKMTNQQILMQRKIQASTYKHLGIHDHVIGQRLESRMKEMKELLQRKQQQMSARSGSQRNQPRLNPAQFKKLHQLFIQQKMRQLGKTKRKQQPIQQHSNQYNKQFSNHHQMPQQVTRQSLEMKKIRCKFSSLGVFIFLADKEWEKLNPNEMFIIKFDSFKQSYERTLRKLQKERIYYKQYLGVRRKPNTMAVKVSQSNTKKEDQKQPQKSIKKEEGIEPKITKKCLLTNGFAFVKSLYKDIHQTKKYQQKKQKKLKKRIDQVSKSIRLDKKGNLEDSAFVNYFMIETMKIMRNQNYQAASLDNLFDC